MLISVYICFVTCQVYHWFDHHNDCVAVSIASWSVRCIISELQNYLLISTMFCFNISWSIADNFTIIGSDCALTGVKRLSEPMLEYFKFDPWEPFPVKFEPIYNYCHVRNWMENVVFKMVAISSRPQCINLLFHLDIDISQASRQQPFILYCNHSRYT